MATESLIIHVNEKGALVVKRNIESIGRAGKGAAGGVKLLGAALGALSVGLVTREFVRLTDQFQRMENRVRVALDGQGDYNKTLQDLFEIADRTRGPVEELTTLYQRTSLASKELGATQDQMLRFVENVGLALAIQGGSADTARGALIQLSQATGAGIVRAEEFNAILEGALPIAQAAARGIERTGGSVARLRREIIDGKVTSEEFFNAILSQSDELERRFGRTQATIGQAFTQLQNALVETVGGFSKATGAGQLLVSTIQGLATFVRDASPIINDFGRAITGTLEPQDELTAGTQLLASAVIILQSAFLQLVGVLKNTVVAAFKAVGNQLGGIAAAIGAALSGEFRQAGQILADSFDDTTQIVVESSVALREDLISDTTDTIEALVQVWDEGARLTAEARQQVFESGRDREQPSIAPTPDPDALKALEKLQDAQRGVLEGLAEERAALELSAATGREYADALQEIQIQQLEAQGGLEGFGEQARASVIAIKELNAEIDRRAELQGNKEFIEDLAVQNEALRVAVSTGQELNDVLEEMAIRKQFINDQEGLGEALDLLESNRKLEEQLADSEDKITDFLRRARENSQDILADALAEGFSGGFDDVRDQFAKLMLDLAAQFVASKIFELLGNIGKTPTGGGGGEGDAVGGIASLLGGFFAGSFANGGSFEVPGQGGVDSQLAMMKVSPREKVTVEKPGREPGRSFTQVNNFILPPEPSRARLGATQQQIGSLTYRAGLKASQRS